MPFNSNGKEQLYKLCCKTQKKKPNWEMSLHQSVQMRRYLSLLQKCIEMGRPRRYRGVEVNPAANVKTVARLKSMGDGWSLQIGLVMVTVTQRRGVGSCCMLKPAGPAGGHIGDQSALLQPCHCGVSSCRRIPPITPRRTHKQFASFLV